MAKRVLAFDFGASSGRAMLATYEGGKITMEEIHRFSNDPVFANGTLYWDTLRLLFEIKEGIKKASVHGGFDSIGIDTWGVDFGLLDSKGNLVQNPVHYRDSRNDAMMEEVFGIIPSEQLYSSTGIQFMQFNTVFQLYYLKKYYPEVIERAKKLLFTPDLFAYFLTGQTKTEYTIASTSQMLDAKTRNWDLNIIQKLGLPEDILCEISKPGTVYGNLSDEICAELGVDPVPVVMCASHDTASAVASVPATDKDFIYVSCGTWSLFGTELPEPLLDKKAFDYNFTNEGGIDGTIRYLKNIMGLWLIQESRRFWNREGKNLSYADLEKQALATEPFKCFINPDYHEFMKPGNLPKKVAAYCEKTGQPVPSSIGETMRCIYESLALKYRLTFDQIKDCTDRYFSKIHIVGGGTKDGLLCQMAANSCAVPVVAGPKEATVLGNIAVQLVATGEIKDCFEARKVVAISEKTNEFFPKETDVWETAYQRFKKIIAIEVE